MSWTKTYPFSAFANGTVDCGRLTEEVEASAIEGLVSVTADRDAGGDTCKLVFVSELGPDDKQYLDALVTDHTGEAQTNVSVVEGSWIFTLSGDKIARWRQHRAFVPFPEFLGAAPSSIEITDAIFDGTANLLVEKITRSGFFISAAATGKSWKGGISSVEFNWRAVA